MWVSFRRSIYRPKLTLSLRHLAFYLIIDLAAGGTSGWFPDNKGGKPWYDGSLSMFLSSALPLLRQHAKSKLTHFFVGAMRDFALAQDVWSATWPANPNDRAFRM